MKGRILDSAGDLAAAEWNRLAGTGNPFARHEFLTALEDSGSATARAGWRPVHILLEDKGEAAGLLPGYLKSHSQGEYVFDHNWADAYARSGLPYYPKLQHASPFTPATAPKLLATDAVARRGLIAAAETLVRDNALSGAHATFLTDADLAAFADAGWLIRSDIQFHWLNQGFSGFDDFLGSLASRKRKTLRREREMAMSGVDEILRLTGTDLTESVWDHFWLFYQDTGSRKWGRPYLTRRFFSLLSERMADAVILVMARRGGRIIAGALNFLGDDCLYGRQWGCSEDIPFLHFELCYHQAIDIACARGLARVEAGAQGQHKISRGYRPVLTRSAHFVADLRFRAAIADYLTRETPAIEAHALELAEGLPFRSDALQ